MRSARPAGVALISVLLVLLAVMVLGIGTLLLTQGNLLISQNLVSTSVARANAEAGLDATVAVLRDAYQQAGDLPQHITQAPGAQLAAGQLDYQFAAPPVWNGNRVTLQVAGHGPRDSEYVSQAIVEFGEVTVTGGSPFTGAIIGCEAIHVVGGGSIDSFDSRNGPYRSNQARQNAHVRTLEDGAAVSLDGGTSLGGNVFSTGTVSVTQGASVAGDINASGTVTLGSGGRTIGGNVRTTGNVNLTNTTTVRGSLSANGTVRFTNAARINGNASAGGDILFDHSNARVDGNAVARGIIREFDRFNRNHVGGAVQPGSAPVVNQPVPEEECDPLGIDSVMAEFASLPTSHAIRTGYPRNNWTVTPESISHFDETYNVNRVTGSGIVGHEVELFGRQTTLYKVDAIELGNGRIRVSGGDVVIYVTGAANLGTGGGQGIVIDPGSSLTLLVAGRTRVASAIRMTETPPVNSNGVPTFAIYSNIRQSTISGWPAYGVGVEGSAQVTAAIYAPYANVGITAGGGFFGAARGRNIEVTGGAGFHFDEALAEVSMGGGGSAGGGGGVRIISRR